MRRSARVIGLLLAASASACASAPQEAEEPLQGAGITVQQAAAGATVAAPGPDAPVLTPGTEFVFRRRGDLTVHLRVTRGEEDGLLRLVDVDSGLRTVMTPDLAEIGRDAPDGEARLVRYLPADPWVHFPLGVGKRWSAEFASHGLRREPVLLHVDYWCDAREEIEVGGGVHDCWRIWRQARLAEAEEPARRRTSVYWYAPAIGFVVKRLDDGELLELVEVRTPEEGAGGDADPGGAP